MQTTTVKIIVPEGQTPKQIKDQIRAESALRNMNSQEFVTLAIYNEISKRHGKKESSK